MDIDIAIGRSADGGVALCPKCRPSGACRLGIVSQTVNEGWIRVIARCPEEHEGAAGIAHGGWIASVLDEVLGMLTLEHDPPQAVTAELRVEFMKPVPVGRDLVIEGWADSHRGHRWQMVGQLCLESSGVQLAGASGTWVGGRKLEHWARGNEWLAEQRQNVAIKEVNSES